ncbi:hypothetical protein ACRV61_002487 [Escherichia albertii]
MDSINGSSANKNVVDFPMVVDEAAPIENILKLFVDAKARHTDDNNRQDEEHHKKDALSVDCMIAVPQGIVHQQIINEIYNKHIDDKINNVVSEESEKNRNILGADLVPDQQYVDGNTSFNSFKNSKDIFCGNESFLNFVEDALGNFDISDNDVVEQRGQEFPRQQNNSEGMFETRKVAPMISDSITQQASTFNEFAERTTTNNIDQYTEGAVDSNKIKANTVNIIKNDAIQTFFSKTLAFNYLQNNPSADMAPPANHVQPNNAIGKQKKTVDTAVLQQSNAFGELVQSGGISITEHNSESRSAMQTTQYTHIASQIEKALHSTRHADVSQTQSATSEINWMFPSQQSANVRIEHGQNRFETIVRVTPSDSEIGEKLANFQQQHPLQTLRVDITPSLFSENQHGQRDSQEQHANQDVSPESEEEA